MTRILLVTWINAQRLHSSFPGWSSECAQGSPGVSGFVQLNQSQRFKKSLFEAEPSACELTIATPKSFWLRVFRVSYTVGKFGLSTSHASLLWNIMPKLNSHSTEFSILCMFLMFIYLLFCVYNVYLCVYTCTPACRNPRRSGESPGTRVTDCFKPAWGCRKSYPGPLQEQ